MNTRNAIAVLTFVGAAVMVLSMEPSSAHSFNVAVVVSESAPSSSETREILNGFMLATAENDGHPDQESDGHLGGLDVYVRLIDLHGVHVAGIERLFKQRDIDIVAALVSDSELALIRKLSHENEIALLPQGQTAVSEQRPSAVAAFDSAYRSEYGVSPSAHAARGYHAARRIDVAVRSRGGTDDKESLEQRFAETSIGYAW